MTTTQPFSPYNAALVPGRSAVKSVVWGQKFSEQEPPTTSQPTFSRTQLANVQGAYIPLPYGGKTRARIGGPRPEQAAAY